MSSMLVFPDGRRVELDDDIVVGRAPVAPEQSPSARSVSLPAPTVSKTHALIGHDDDGVWLVDLHSSNGSEALDEAGRRQPAVPGQRLAIPVGSHIRLGTDTIITVDPGAAADGDDLDRTVVRPAPSSAPEPPAAPPAVPPSPVTHAADQNDAVDWSAVDEPGPAAPSNPAPSAPLRAAPRHDAPPAATPPLGQPPTPPSQPPPPAPPAPPPPPVAAATQQFARTPPASAGLGSQPGPAHGLAPDAFVAPPPPARGRSTANTVGAIVVLVWSAVSFADLRGWIPDFVVDALDGRIIDFFTAPDEFTLQFFEFFNVVSLPESLDFLARGADIGPVVAVLVAVVALAAPKLGVRLLLVLLVAIPMILLVGLLVTFGADSFDFITEEFDRFVPWFVLPAIGSLLLLLPGGRSSDAATPSGPASYAPGQPPEPSPSGPSYS